MKTKLMKITALLIGLFFVFSLFTQSAAAVVWSDNFDDGNYDGWTVEDGTYSVTDLALRSETTGDLNSIIWYPSTITAGTWNFSFMYDDSENTDATYFIMFMSMNQTININMQSGYGIEIYQEMGLDARIRLVKQDGGWASTATLVIPSFVEDLRGTWTDFAVSRNSTGGFNVWINGTHTWEVVNTEHDTSEMFVFYSYLATTGAGGGHLDDIVVDDDPISPYAPITTPEPTTTETPIPTDPGNGEPFILDPMILALGGGAVVVLLVIVVFVKKR